MKTSWPRVEVRVTRQFQAEHRLPKMGNPELHAHDYEVVFGTTREINPALGATSQLREFQRDVDTVIARIRGRDLGEFMPVPTAEWLACWLLANVGCDEMKVNYLWDYVIVRAYGCYETRIDRRHITNEWLDSLRCRSFIPVPIISLPTS